MLLSELVERYLAKGNDNALGLLRRISPVAWQYLYFLGHFLGNGQIPLVWA